MRFTAGTLNLWKTKRWPEREPALHELIRRHRPDILGVQELRAEHLPAIERALPHHERVRAWNEHGSLFWNASRFTAIDHGAEDVGLIEGGSLFWVRLEHGSHRLIAAVVHLDWPGIDQEKATATNVRIAEATRVGEALDRICAPGESVLLLADLNDCTHAVWILGDRFGYADAYGALGRKPLRTYPSTDAEEGAPQVLDWIFFRGDLAPIMVDTVQLLVDRIAPSDHRMVLACFELPSEAGR